MIFRPSFSLRSTQRHFSIKTFSSSSFLSPNDFQMQTTDGSTASTPQQRPKSTAAHSKPEYSFKLGVHLSKYGADLTRMAVDGEIEAVIGRENEIQQTIRVLSRRRKNNPCLIGEPGVGKDPKFVRPSLFRLIFNYFIR